MVTEQGVNGLISEWIYANQNLIRGLVGGGGGSIVANDDGAYYDLVVPSGESLLKVSKTTHALYLVGDLNVGGNLNFGDAITDTLSVTGQLLVGTFSVPLILTDAKNYPAGFFASSAGTVSGTRRGSYSRLAITGNATNGSFYGSQAQCKVTAAATISGGGNLAGLWAYFETLADTTILVDKQCQALQARIDLLDKVTCNYDAAGITVETGSHSSATISGDYCGIIIRDATSPASSKDFEIGIKIDDACTGTGIQIGTCTTGVSVTGATTTGVKVTGSASTAFDAQTGTFTTGLNLAGTLTNGIIVGACSNGVTVQGTSTRAFLVQGAATYGLEISGTTTTGIYFSGTTTTGIDFGSVTPTWGGDNALIDIGTWTVPLAVTPTDKFCPIQANIASSGVGAYDVAAARFRVDSGAGGSQNLNCLQLRQKIAHNIAQSATVQASVDISAAVSVATGETAVGYFSLDGTGALTMPGSNSSSAIVGSVTNTGGAITNVAYFRNAASTTVTNMVNIEVLGTSTNMFLITNTGTATNFMKFSTDAAPILTNALVPAAAPDAGTVGADKCLRILIDSTPYYLALYDTLHA